MFILISVIILIIIISTIHHMMGYDVPEIKATWAIIAGIFIQVALFTPSIYEFSHSYNIINIILNDQIVSVFNVMSYLLFLFGTISNFNYISAHIIALGILLNTLAIVSNGGYMPIYLQSAIFTGHFEHYYNNPYLRSVVLDNPSFPLIIDRAVLLWPPFFKIAFSIGDTIIISGMISLTVERFTHANPIYK